MNVVQFGGNSPENILSRLKAEGMTGNPVCVVLAAQAGHKCGLIRPETQPSCSTALLNSAIYYPEMIQQLLCQRRHMFIFNIITLSD